MSKPGSRWTRSAGQVGYVLLGMALVAGVVRSLIHAGQDVYYIPAFGVGIAVGAFVAGVAGIVLGWRSGRFGSVALTMLGVAVGMAVVVSVSVLLLAVGVAFLSVSVMFATRGRLDASVSGAGVLLGAGVFVLALVALSPPLVDCADGSVGENILLGLESSSTSGSGSPVSPDGHTNRGRVQADTYAYTYTCRNGKLIDFALRRR